MLDRRGFMAGLAALGASGAARAASVQSDAGGAFSWDILRAEARDLAARPYKARAMVPKAWRELSYDLYKSIWFDERHALWRKDEKPLEVDFFHPGLYFPRAVEVNVVKDGRACPVAFDWDAFDKTDKVPDLPVDETVSFSGFRLRGEIERKGVFQEYAVFQGASYFRAIGKGQFYGLSARGIALKTADKRGEEFPDFTKFWIETPKPGATSTVIYALLDGPSVSGAYRIETTPGEATVMSVRSALFPRVELDHVGIGPLTSMFLYDQTNRTRFDDFRPAVHDSDGLQVWNGAGEMLWRPLANPKALQVSSFVDNGPRGFGLMQRAREFRDFADLEALYHKRPSLWVEPGEDWGRGSVTLVEIPADREIYDNVVAYWRPRTPLPAGEEASFTYRLNWGEGTGAMKPVAEVLNTSIGARFGGGYIAAIDFAAHAAVPEDLSRVSVMVRSGSAETSAGVLQRNPDTGGPRLAFSFDPGERRAVEMRAQLSVDGQTISEVWLYRWTA